MVSGAVGGAPVKVDVSATIDLNIEGLPTPNFRARTSMEGLINDVKVSTGRSMQMARIRWRKRLRHEGGGKDNGSGRRVKDARRPFGTMLSRHSWLVQKYHVLRREIST